MAFWEKNCKGFKIVFDTETESFSNNFYLTLLYTFFIWVSIKITVHIGKSVTSRKNLCFME